MCTLGLLVQFQMPSYCVFTSKSGCFTPSASTKEKFLLPRQPKGGEWKAWQTLAAVSVQGVLSIMHAEQKSLFLFLKHGSLYF